MRMRRITSPVRDRRNVRTDVTLRVAYIGNHLPPYGTESQVAYALERIGCTVDRIQQEDAYQDFTGTYNRLNATQPALCLYTRTHNRTALDAAGRTFFGALEADGIITATLHLDAFVGLQREHFLRDRDPMFTVQHVFTADGSPECADAMEAHGYNHHWLPPGLDERVLERAPSAPRVSPELVFVGSRFGYHEEHGWRGQLFDTMESKYGNRFCWYGNGSPRGTLRGPELDGLYASAGHVIVGDSCFAGARHAYFSDRLVETLGRSGLLLHPDLHGCMYEDGRHYLAYDPTPDGLVAAVEDALAMSVEERMSIKREARSIVERRDLWRHRMTELLSVVGLGVDASIG